VADRRPALGPFDRAFGVTVAVTLPGAAAAVSATAILNGAHTETVSVPGEPIGDLRLSVSLRRDQVPLLPIGSLLTGPLLGASETFRVNLVRDLDPDYHHAMLDKVA
jgi:hypothetical protein